MVGTHHRYPSLFSTCTCESRARASPRVCREWLLPLALLLLLAAGAPSLTLLRAHCSRSAARMKTTPVLLCMALLAVLAWAQEEETRERFLCCRLQFGSVCLHPVSVQPSSGGHSGASTLGRAFAKCYLLGATGRGRESGAGERVGEGAQCERSGGGR